jgi:hypothetical protein
MKNYSVKYILFFFLGMLAFGVVSFAVSHLILVERPTQDGIIEDWESICFWPDEDGIYVEVSPKGCFATTCTRPTLQTGTATIDLQNHTIQLETRFMIATTSRFPLPCIDNCSGGGTVQLNLGYLMPNIYEVWFRGQKVGEMNVFSGLPTPRQCFQNETGGNIDP